MKRWFVYIVAPWVIWACSYTQGGDGIVRSILSPANGSSGQALDVPVTATYEGSASDHSSELDYFTLRKDNSGDSLCTSVTYDTSSHVYTCNHDSLDPDSSYTTFLQSRPFEEGGTTTFTTGSGAAASLMKAAWKYEGGSGLIELDFKFLSNSRSPLALGGSVVPKVMVSPDIDVAVGTPTCRLSDDRTQLHCTVGGIETCAECAEFNVNLSADGISNFGTTLTFTDDE